MSLSELSFLWCKNFRMNMKTCKAIFVFSVLTILVFHKKLWVTKKLMSGTFYMTFYLFSTTWKVQAGVDLSLFHSRWPSYTHIVLGYLHNLKSFLILWFWLETFLCSLHCSSRAWKFNYYHLNSLFSSAWVQIVL